MDTVNCPGCGEENPAKFRLCGFCGTPLVVVPEVVTCPSCGEENPGKFRLCGFCGTPLAGGGPAAPGLAQPPPATAVLGAPPAPHDTPEHLAPLPLPVAPPVAPPVPPVPATDAPPALGLPSHDVRKIVTLLFTDLKDSTALGASIDSEAMGEIKARYFADMAAEIERHGGSVEKNVGDAIMAVFGRIRAREDDALRAVRAAHAMQRVLAALNAEFERFYGVQLTVRTGVNTGEVVANQDEHAVTNLATGPAVNVAARLEQNAPANEVLIGADTYDLVKRMVEVEELQVQLKGYAEPMTAYRLVAVRDAPVDLPSAVHAASLIGRDEELRLLHDAFGSAAGGARTHVVTVVGEPGVGKSRLVKDFVAAVAGEANVLAGRCLPYGDGITFWPLSEAARGAAGIEQDDDPATARAKLLRLLAGAGEEADEIVDRLAAAIGLSPARFPVSELYWGGRRFLEVLAAERPVVLIVDDIHSAEATFLEFLEHLIEAQRGARLVVLCTARLHLLEKRPDWGDGAGMTRIVLEPLSAEDTAGLVAQLLGDTGIDEEVHARVVAAADGNPLFVEQMVSMLVDKGLLRREGDRWVPARAMADLAVPPSIQALLASRLDDLSREERVVVEPAAVIGLVFFQPAVEEMVPGQLRPAVAEHLGALDRKQFVLREADDDDGAYRFRHLLIRDATYGSLLKRTRAQLHERFVGWAERVNRERGREQEFEEILGYHLEQAYRYRTELGPLDDAGREVARRASTKLANAGRRAFARGDLPAASNLLRRAAALLPSADPERIALQCDLADVLLEDGEFGASSQVLDEASAAAQQSADRQLIDRTRIARSALALFGGEGDVNVGDVVADTLAAIERFDAAEDPAGSARGWRLLSAIHATAGRWEDAARSNERVIATARRAGDGRLAARGAIGYAVSMLHGPTPSREGLRRSEALFDEVAGDRKAEAVLLGVRALLHAMVGEFEEARALAARGRAALVELGPSVTASATSTESGRVELLAGDHAAAERELVRDLEALERLNERYYRSTIAGLLAHARAGSGDLVAADDAASLAEQLSDPDDAEAQILWRSARAKIRAAQGRADEAVALGREAVELAASTVDLMLHADALADLGEALVRSGRAAEARPVLEAALALYEQKEAPAAAARVRAALTGALVS